jgi:hypothetical protein
LEVKGTALRSILVALENAEGKERAAAVRDRLPPDVRATIEPVILAARWYPVAVQAAIHEAIRTTIGQGRTEANYRIAVRAAHDDLGGGVYQTFFRLMTYDLLWEASTRLWQRYNSRGKVEFRERTRGRAVGTVEGVESYTLPMWVAVAGRLHGFLEIAGASAVRVSVHEHDATRVVMVAEWKG